MEHAIHHINGLFITVNSNKKKVKKGLVDKLSIINLENEQLMVGHSLQSLVDAKDVLLHLQDFCVYSMEAMLEQSSLFPENDFVLNQKYTRKDVFRILQWDENPVAQNVGGYMVEKTEKDCAIFVNYHKDEDISSTTKYHDRFISRNEFIWMSKSKRKIDSPDVSKILNQASTGIRLPLFVKKSNIEGTDFYYLGNMTVQKETAVVKKIQDDNSKSVSVVEMTFLLESPVEKSLYDYLVSSN